MSQRITPPWGRHYPPYQITALVRLLQRKDVPAGAVLAGTGLDAAALDDVACRTSVLQHLAVWRNALELRAVPGLSFELGRGLHLPDHGTYGLMLLSCESVDDYFRRAETYQGLVANALALEARTDGGDALWVLGDGGDRELPDGLRIFVLEQQFAQLVTQLHDLLGPEVRPTLARFAYPAPAHRAMYAEQLQCPCIFGWHRNELHFGGELLSMRPRLANAFTAAVLQSACEGLLAEVEESPGFAGKVYQALRLLPDPGAGMKAMASTFKMNERTLRRRLAREGTSFSNIADQVRHSVATQHLQRPDASVEQIALITGFSDSANFRRAFLRWTGMTPAQFRRQHQERRAHPHPWTLRGENASVSLAAP
ncbi:AraC family transcriptional regulator [Variovorax sp. J31P207]|uniref:AraC family transcriptional regulator n=1 Tax=Variovorax sp. J31P207 TaxID=3053510 RepID=UPI002577FB87|nr:AraC family transcriptional regulator [Variovorax sp. J31P207]MDM0066386.1 AraC family transcriptional regulator [Variovorax sp. J31P207]